MQKTVFLVIATCALLNLPSSAHAAGTSTTRRAAQICAMCKNKSTRMLMIHELTCTTERKLELAKKLKEDPGFRAAYDTGALDRS